MGLVETLKTGDRGLMSPGYRFDGCNLVLSILKFCGGLRFLLGPTVFPAPARSLVADGGPANGSWWRTVEENERNQEAGRASGKDGNVPE